MAIQILVTDRNCEVVGDPIYCWETVDCTLRFNEVSSGQLTMPAHPWIREQLDPGNRIVVIRDGQIFMAGPWERKFIERSDDGENSGIGKLTIEFADDLALVVNRIAMPNPALTAEAQDRDYWEYNANVETVLQDLANVSAGPGARPERRIPQLIMGGATGVGTTVTGKLRLEQLGDAMRSIALAGGDIGFRTRQVGKSIVFETYGPRDLSGSVRFSFGLGNLRYLGYEESAPNATTAIVGGQGEGADRFITSRTAAATEAVWQRGEMYVARAGNDPPAELQAAADETLARETATVRLQSSAWDTEDQHYGEHYGLGDRVSVEVGPGQEVTDLVRLVHLQAWATAGELVSAMVGGQDATSDPQWINRMRLIEQRLARMERRAMPSSAT
ncbi:siphovirus ReqiPepy6 Gp37-like family protein [Micromonospora maritima]|uniref:siphovirus ReqiPepy6 Gp37-like family protein n=1 Tax=Micromonospora maritima TaxID=986711 RepID=UPI00157C7A44|nr:siphovirus ReqiPepy6 Gp37-like family protein [Micromonospora maritima]